jgi:hypothetical protein
LLNYRSPRRHQPRNGALFVLAQVSSLKTQTPDIEAVLMPPPAGGAAPAAQPHSAPVPESSLPEVEVIQDRPKVEPAPEPIQEAAPKERLPQLS